MGNTAKINLVKFKEMLNEDYAQEDIFRIMSFITECCVDSGEAVQHPDHYQGKHECIEVMRAMFGDAAVMNFCKCNSFKYRFRSSAKNGEEDIEKAEWYEDYLINMQNPQKNIIGGI